MEFSYGENQLVLKIYRQLRLLFIACITLLVLVLFTTVKNTLRPVPSSPAVVVPQSFNPGDVLLAPEFPLTTKLFETPGRILALTEEVQQRWEQDMPRGRGFVRVPTGRNLSDPDDDIYVVSVYHQLHCLYMMQESFSRAMENPSQVPPGEVEHTYHCAELLRQVLKCTADPTLDSTVPGLGDKPGRATSGWNSVHVCRDYDRLYEWTESHRTNDRVGAGILPGHHDGHRQPEVPMS